MAGVASLMQNMSPAERAAFVVRLNEGSAGDPNAPSGTPGTGGFGGMGGVGRAIDKIGGFSTLGSLAGLGLGSPILGMVGSGIDVARDYGTSQQFDPGYSPGLGGVLSSIGNEFTRGLIGQSMLDGAIGQYQGRTGTGLNREALAAGVTGGGYSGPKGIVGPRAKGRVDRGGGGVGTRARSQPRSTAPGRRGARDTRGGGGAEGGRGASSDGRGDRGPGSPGDRGY